MAQQPPREQTTWASPFQSPIKTLVPLGIIFGFKDVDFVNNETAKFWLRVGFVVCQGLAIALTLFIFHRVKAVNDERKIEGTTETVVEHDSRHSRQALSGAIGTGVIVGYIHACFGFWHPLVLVGSQCVLNFTDGAHLKLLKAYVLAKPVERPFGSGKRPLPSWLEAKLDSKRQAAEDAKKAAAGTATAAPAKKSKKAD